MEDGSLAGAGVRADQAHARADGQDDGGADHGVSTRAARPTPTCRWAARADRSGARLRSPSFGSRRRRRRRRQIGRRQDREGHGRCQSARSAAGRDLRRQERPQAGDRPGRASRSTARTTRPGASTTGPAGATSRTGGLRPRQADRHSRRHDPHVQAGAEPRRLEQRRQPEPQPRPVPAGDHDRAETRPPTRCRPRSARSWRRRARSGRRPRPTPSSATGGRRSRNGRRPTPGSRHSGGGIRRAHSQLVLTRARPAPADPSARAGRFPQAGRGGRARRAGVLEPAAVGCAAHPAVVRPLAGRPRLADDRAVAGQPGLAGVFRHGHRGHQRRPRPPVRAAIASRAARLAGRRVHGERLEPEAPAPADRDIGDLSPVVARDARASGARPVQPPAGAGAAVPGRRRDRARHRPGGQRAPGSARSAARASSRRRPRFCSSRRPATGRRSGSRRPAPTAIAAPSTPSGIARCRIPCSRRSTHPTAISPACAARDRTRRSRR